MADVLHVDLDAGERLRVLSDLHLGHPASLVKDVQQLEPLLNDVNVLILAGDTWQPIFGAAFEQSKRMLDRLLLLCEELGIRSVLLRGNHDPVEDYPMAAYVSGKRYFITHGHAIFREGAPWSKALNHCQKDVDAYWASQVEEDLTLEERLHGSYEISRVMLPKCGDRRTPYSGISLPRFVAMFRSWRDFPKASAEFLKRFSPESECMIAGHFHRAGDWCIDEKRIINMGAFTRASRMFAVDICDEKVEVVKIARRANSFVTL